MADYYFSKWAGAYPLPGQEAQAVGKEYAERCVRYHSGPPSLCTAQGRSFESQLIYHIYNLLEISTTCTMPSRPQSDGLVEQFKSTLVDMLSSLITDNQTEWDEILPYVMMAYRSSVQSSPGYTPFTVLFGWEICLPVGVVSGVNISEGFNDH